MAIAGYILILIGGIIGLVYGIKLLALAFHESIWWGLGYLLIPFVGLIFIILHWYETKKPFLKWLLAIPFYIVGQTLVSIHNGTF